MNTIPNYSIDSSVYYHLVTYHLLVSPSKYRTQKVWTLQEMPSIFSELTIIYEIIIGFIHHCREMKAVDSLGLDTFD